MVEGDFKILGTDGAAFESLVEALCIALGFRVESRPAVGPDGGRDLLLERWVRDPLHESTEKVLVQCKHYASSGKAVGERDILAWRDAMDRSNAHGYLLVTDTRVTENLKNAFKGFSARNEGRWAAFWNVDNLIQLLHRFPDVRRAFFPGKSLEIDPPPLVGHLIRRLGELAEQSDRAFDEGNWDEFADRVAETRKELTTMAMQEAREHFELYYHVKRSNHFPRLQQLLSTQQLAYERLDEARAVDSIVSKSSTKARASFQGFAAALGKLDEFRQATFELARKEAEWLTPFAPNPKKLVMIGCGALPYTLLHACLKSSELSCTGLDYDNGSLVLAHRVREHLRLGGQLHYVTQNGHVFDYRNHDVILVANIVSQKHQVLERVAATAPRGAVVVVRNPVTFGELLWHDARYTYVNGLELAGRFDAKPFDQCFETVVLRKL